MIISLSGIEITYSSGDRQNVDNLVGFEELSCEESNGRQSGIDVRTEAERA